MAKEIGCPCALCVSNELSVSRMNKVNGWWKLFCSLEDPHIKVKIDDDHEYHREGEHKRCDRKEVEQEREDECKARQKDASLDK